MKKKYYNEFTSQFTDNILENSYQEKQKGSLTKLIQFSMLIFFLNILFMIYSDFFLTKNFYLDNNQIIYMRIMVALYLIAANIYLPKYKEFKKVENIVLGFFFILIIANGVGHATFPFPERNYYSTEIMVIFALYLLFPVDIRIQLFGGIGFALTCLISLDVQVQPQKIYYHTIGMLINANLLGYFFSRYYHRIIRKIYFHMEEENRINIELSNKKEDLKAISGIIPICYKCNSIRDDAGYTKKLEEYIIENTDAQFTHSMCPECTKLYLKQINDID